MVADIGSVGSVGAGTKQELINQRVSEFMKNNPGFGGTFPNKLKKEVEEEGLTHKRENMINDYFPWKLESDPTKSQELYKAEQRKAHMTPEELEILEGERKSFTSKARSDAAMSDAILPLLLEQISGNMDYGYSPHIPSLTNPDASRLLDLIGDSPVQRGLPGGEITTPKTERPFNPELMYQEGGPVPVPNNEDFNLVDFYNSLEQDYQQSPEGEAELHGKGTVTGDIVKFLTGLQSPVELGVGTGYRALVDFLTKPAGFKGSQPEGMTYAEGDTAHSQIDELMDSNDMNEQLSSFLDAMKVHGAGGGLYNMLPDDFEVTGNEAFGRNTERWSEILANLKKDPVGAERFSAFLKGLQEEDNETWFNPEGVTYDTSVPVKRVPPINPR